MNINNLTKVKKVQLKKFLSTSQTWLITGVGGFIGSNILNFLLKNNQKVIGIDNFSTGKLLNIKQYLFNKNFIFKKTDIRNKKNLEFIKKLKIDYVIHLAASVSVQQSIQKPNLCNKINVKGFENLVDTINKLNIKKIIFASSSAVYGNNKNVNSERSKLMPLSPYAMSKIKNEIYARKQSTISKIKFIALRYFNIFGKNQHSTGGYASVIPKWNNAMLKRRKIYIYGNGNTTRDFCHVDNVIFANILAAMSKTKKFDVFNVGSGRSTNLNTLFKKICIANNYHPTLIYKKFKKGDIYISLCSLKKIRKKLGYNLIKNIDQGLKDLAKNKY